MSFADTPSPTVRGPRGTYRGTVSSAGGGREILLFFILAAGVFFLIGAISARQVTSPPRAMNVLRAGIATTTEIDLLLQENLPEMKRAAEAADAETWAVPGFPIDVVLTREEVLDYELPEIRTLVLDRAGAIVYDRGLDAFDTTGEQSVGLLSAQWVMDLFIGQLSSTNHSRANLALYFFGAVVMVSSVLVLLFSDAFSGFRRLGAAVFAGAGLGLALTGVAWLIAGQVGGDDPFMTDLREIVRTVLAAPLRNYLIGTLLGVLIFALGPLLALVARRAGVETGYGGDDYVPGPDEPATLGPRRPPVR